MASQPEGGIIAGGYITEGPETSLVESTLQFVSSQLVSWRDDPDRTPENGEERLNAQLCKYLNAAASHHFPMVLFSHEEKQTGTRRVDFAANPQTAMFFGETYHTIYDPFLVFEGKRLPTPTLAREREYVSGGPLKSGGIQRFKLGLHGAGLGSAALIGYVQQETLDHWFSKVNDWISSEAVAPSGVGETWSSSEQLSSFSADSVQGYGSASSLHARSSPEGASSIQLSHFWVVMC